MNGDVMTMRYYSYNEFDPDSTDADEYGGYVVTMSEEDIRKQYYPYWYDRMCKKFGKDHVDATFSFEDCLDDCIVVNWAWKVKN